MDVFVYSKEFFKESPSVRDAILTAIDVLYSRIQAYEAQHVDFCRIFNDPSVKYDKHGEFFTFKTQKGNLQLRILYSYQIVNGIPVIILADFHIKKKNCKDYIKKFEYAKHLDPLDVYAHSCRVS